MDNSLYNDLNDIEDLIDVGENRRERRGIVSRVKKRAQKKTDDQERSTVINNDHIYTSSVPGSEKIYLKTWGCTHNSSDGEYMAGLLSAYGYHITGKPIPI